MRKLIECIDIRRPSECFLLTVYTFAIHLSAGYSEDSDYTSDLNYPVGGQGANSSASQFRTAANQLATPQRSLETSRENSYERDDHQVLIDRGIAKREPCALETLGSNRCAIIEPDFDVTLSGRRVFLRPSRCFDAL